MAVYTIKSGDTLTKIANLYGVTVADLLAANPNITNPDLIFAGANLTIPVAGNDDPTGGTTGGTTGTTTPTTTTGTSGSGVANDMNQPDGTYNDTISESQLKSLLDSYGGVTESDFRRILNEVNSGQRSLANLEYWMNWRGQQSGYTTPAAVNEASMNIYEDAEWWVVDGELYATYFVPGTSPPVPYLWHVQDEGALVRIFGEGGWSQDFVNRELTAAQLDQVGGLIQGTTADIPNVPEGSNPYDIWAEQWEAEALTRPEFSDPEVMALYFEALIEGRDVTASEFHSTEWWRSKTAAERDWLTILFDDPSSAEQLKEDNRIAMQLSFEQAGVFGLPASVSNALADLATTGAISLAEAKQQVAGLADPSLGVVILPEISALLSGVTVDTNVQHESTVRDLVSKWLGPQHGQWSDAQVAEWASQIRRTPDGVDELTNMLRQQRLALFPEYGDASLTYEDIASPWRNQMTQIWGETPDETDPFFLDIVRMNDSASSLEALRREGLKRGNESVKNWFQGTLNESFGTLRRSV